MMKKSLFWILGILSFQVELIKIFKFRIKILSFRTFLMGYFMSWSFLVSIWLKYTLSCGPHFSGEILRFTNWHLKHFHRDDQHDQQWLILKWLNMVYQGTWQILVWSILSCIAFYDFDHQFYRIYRITCSDKFVIAN